MIEVVLGQSAAGALKAVRGTDKTIGDICEIDLCLSIGDASGDNFESGRTEVIKCQHNACFDFGVEISAMQAEKSIENLKRLKKHSADEPLRIWYCASMPDEICGLYFLAEFLDGGNTIYTVRLSKTINRSGKLVDISCSGELDSKELCGFAQNCTELKEEEKEYMRSVWQRVKTAPLRAVVNGRLVGVAEDFYDEFIRREAEQMSAEISESALIGNVLQRYHFGIGDGWCALRITEMINNREFEIIRKQTNEFNLPMPKYAVILKKK